jgi:thiamine pyrophosphate-dependent acetolactate synthase large subunit-like protein
MAKTVAEHFIETLAAAGIRRIFGIVGDCLNGFADVLQKTVFDGRATDFVDLARTNLWA